MIWEVSVGSRLRDFLVVYVFIGRVVDEGYENVIRKVLRQRCSWFNGGDDQGMCPSASNYWVP